MNTFARVLTSALLVSLMAPSLLFAQGDAAAGQAKSALCGSCHGADGNSVLSVNPKLAGQNAKYMVKQMMDFKSRARPGQTMVAMIANVSEQDMQDIAAYYASQTVTVEGADEASIELAQTLYRAGNQELSVAACSACHSPTGSGNEPAGYPALGGQHADYTLLQLKDFRSGTRENDEAGMMQTTVERLTDRELEALASYLSGLN
ncbi:MAG: c-type cytochrome [Gammaproteobacteria bacterium]|jgi:cytochrome c553|nr:cytochrome c4 [Gammaproteobacteria bacterium]MDP6094624.1 c-type cytochrome [Gammaproteobacteria bacterium]HJO11780.1 c-type cytochrome [Gammaproteobacteria bacterium]